MSDYLKIGKAIELSGKNKIFYRLFEIFPGFLSWGTLITLAVLSYFHPIFVAYFIIAFDIYWLLLVLFLSIHLISSYGKMKKNISVDWRQKCEELGERVLEIENFQTHEKRKINLNWRDIVQLTILPIYKESKEVVATTLEAIKNCGYPTENMIIILSVEERAGQEALSRAKEIEKEFGSSFRKFILTIHPENIEGELKGKGANQAWAGRIIKKEVIDKEGIDYDKILVNVFDIDTVIYPNYYYVLAYRFLNAEKPYRTSYQPIPVYHNNIWQAPFFARVAASSNTFWQMMQQIRQEKLATYSSHSMTWRALVDVDFWSVSMVSEDSRIFWHCYFYYNGDYRVEPLYYPVSMDVTMDETMFTTAKNLYKQQRRWGWGVENVPYILFNTIKKWKLLPKKKTISRILVQIYGFHSWATNALIIAVIGWMPIFLGGDDFNNSVLSANLPIITRNLMTIAMSGLVISAIISTCLLPPRPTKYGFWKSFGMVAQWALLPLSIIIFGSVPGLDAQSRLMAGKYMGFFVTPKKR
ncbi:MAG: glycosyltransferase family 2 protein [bacterium]